MKVLKTIRFLLLMGALGCAEHVFSMESMPTSVWVQASDGYIRSIEKWKIDQMGALQVLLVHQKGMNSYDDPIDAAMLTSLELGLLDHAFTMIKIGELDFFYNSTLSLQQNVDRLRTLINSAQKVEATSLSALCASYIFPKEMQTLIIKHIMQQVMPLLIAPERKQLGEYYGLIKKVQLSPDGTMVLSCGSGFRDNLVLLDVATGKQHYSLVGHMGIVETAAFSPDGTKIVSGSKDSNNNVLVWDVATGNQLYNLVGHQEGLCSVAFSPDGTKIVSGSEGNNNNLLIWDVATGNQLYNLAGHQEGVYSVAFSPDGTKIVSGGYGNQNNLFVWDVATGNQLYNLVGHQDSVYSVAFSPDGTKIVSGGYGNQNNVFVWDVATGNQLYNLAGHQNTVNMVAFSPDGTKIVSGGFGGANNLFMWDVATGNQLYNLVGHQISVYGVAFSPDGNMLVSGGEGRQNNLFVWDVTTGNQLYSLVQPSSVLSVACDSDSIVAGGLGHLYVWSFFKEQHTLLQSLTIAQARLLYRMYCAKMSGFTMTIYLHTIDYEAYRTLPKDIKKKVCDIFPVVIEGCEVQKERVEEEKEPEQTGGCCIS